jgi:UDP-sugar pyrophosphorylase
MPSVPQGVVVEPFSPDFFNYEMIGATALGRCGFVLVAGGLGERLGFSGIKISLPTENTTNTCFIEVYARSILAIQKQFAEPGFLVPLAIMVSGDTETQTLQLFKDHDNFGLQPEQVYFMKQEEVAALLDNDARIAVSDTDPYHIITKPHGHGDVHSLMYNTGVGASWAAMGIEWVYFFQDTNALSFRSLPCMLGVSKLFGYDMNSMAVPRKAKQAIGAIARLVKDSSVENPADPELAELTINVEYNQLDPLLRATGHPDGDVNDPITGLSVYPGNINELLFNFPAYWKVLSATHGVVGEFVNPKYADAAREAFQKPTRLECMMQDFPKAVQIDQSRIGFTMVPSWFSYSPVKNALSSAVAMLKSGIPPACPMSGESDIYMLSVKVLKLIGCHVEEAEPSSFGGILAPLGPRIVLDPSFASCLSDLTIRFPNPSAVKISSRSTLFLSGNVVVQSLDLDGALFVQADFDGSCVVVHTGANTVHNAAHEFVPHVSSPALSQREQEIRSMYGYDLVRHETKDIDVRGSDHTYLYDGIELKKLA